VGEKKVLVADDSANMVNLIKYNLKKAGYVVVEARDGEEALSKAISEKPDLIILDVNMPKKTGFEVCRELRKKPETTLVPIVIVSARSQEYDKLAGFGFGADDYIIKPFNVDDLLLRVSHLIYGGSTTPASLIKEEQSQAKPVLIGQEKIDSLFPEGIIRGSNILLVGRLGTGKSTLARQFLACGVKNREVSLFVSVEDPIESAVEKLGELAEMNAEELLKSDTFKIVGPMELEMVKTANIEDTLKMIIETGMEIGHSIQKKSGGRRVVDSISGLVLSFGEAPVYQFLSQIVHTSKAFGGVTTIYTLADEAVTGEQSANIKNFMDIVIQLKVEPAGVYAQITNMKWAKYNTSKVKLWTKM
jgi:CheY-like chemotaxis protein/KaiC/GvpD/RAD55 family RecA-like ATPase